MKCLNCDKDVMGKGQQLLPNSFAGKPGSIRVYEHDEGGEFVRCPNPKCKAKNYTENLPCKEGEPLRKKFSHFKLDN